MACGKLVATVSSGRQGQIPKEYAELCLRSIGETRRCAEEFHLISRISGITVEGSIDGDLKARQGGGTRPMQYTDDQLNRIYDRTSGYCHICARSSLLRTTASTANEGRGTWSIRVRAQKAARIMGITFTRLHRLQPREIGHEHSHSPGLAWQAESAALPEPPD